MTTGIDCSACNAIVQQGSKFCPGCGLQLTAQAAPVVERVLAPLFPWWGWVLVAFVVVIGIVIAVNSDNPAQQAQRASQQASDAAAQKAQTARLTLAANGAAALRDRMRDPDSFKVTSALVLSDDTVCYEYRSRNGFGGMNDGYAVLIKSLLASQPGAALDGFWELDLRGQDGNGTVRGRELCPGVL